MLQIAAPARVRLVQVRHVGGVRTLAILDAEGRERYVRLVAGSAERVERALSHNVVAHRVAVATVEPPELRLRPWRLERRAFVHRLSELARRVGCLAFADVKRCYASISPAMAGDALRRLGVEDTSDLEAFLCDLELEGVRGLPVGPEASAVLANAVLAPVDRALEEEGIAHLRWVDDLVLASADPRRALSVLRRALDPIGLRLNPSKTRVVFAPSSGNTPDVSGPRQGTGER